MIFVFHVLSFALSHIFLSVPLKHTSTPLVQTVATATGDVHGQRLP